MTFSRLQPHKCDDFLLFFLLSLFEYFGLLVRKKQAVWRPQSVEGCDGHFYTILQLIGNFKKKKKKKDRRLIGMVVAVLNFSILLLS